MTPVVLAFAGCASHAIRYEPVSFPLDRPSEAFAASLPGRIAQDLEHGRLRSLEDTEGTALAPKDLPDEVLYGLYSVVRPWARGAEFDLLVDLGQGTTPVSVWFGRDRRAQVAWSQAEVRRAGPPEALPPLEWAAAAAEQHGLSGIHDDDVRWTHNEIGDVVTALVSLTPEERRTLTGVELVRASASPRSARDELAYFDPTYEPPRIQFFDAAFVYDEFGFIGDPEAPVAAAAMTAVHEFGHVLADAPLRRAYNDYLEKYEAWTSSDPEGEDSANLQAASRAAYREYRSMGRRGPVLDAWKAFRGARRGPSSYGDRNLAESFAEAFAMVHLDPAALERVFPGAVAWFTDGTHIQASGVWAE